VIVDIETLRFARYIVDMGAGFTLSLAALFALLVALRARRGDTDLQRRLVDVLVGFQGAIGEQTSAAREQLRAMERLNEAITSASRETSTSLASLDASVSGVDVDVKALSVEIAQVAPAIQARLDEHQRALLEQLAPIPARLSEMYVLLRDTSARIEEHHRETSVLVATQQRVASELASIHALVREVFDMLNQPTKEQEDGDDPNDQRHGDRGADSAAESSQRGVDVPLDADGALGQGEGVDPSPA
jgi:septal ring factor EnvC (AmiA/AmiB activator)